MNINLKVIDFIEHSISSWNVRKLQEMFPPRDIEIIRQQRPFPGREDSYIYGLKQIECIMSDRIMSLHVVWRRRHCLMRLELFHLWIQCLKNVGNSKLHPKSESFFGKQLNEPFMLHISWNTEVCVLMKDVYSVTMIRKR